MRSQLADLFESMAALLGAGVPLLRTLRALAASSSPELAELLEDLSAAVAADVTLSAAMARRPDAFDALTVAYVRAGEVGGVLHATTAELADLLRADDPDRERCFCWLLGRLLSAGVPLAAALLAAAEALDEPRRAVCQAAVKGLRGQGLGAAFRASGLFSPRVVEFVTAGEETGRLDVLCERVARIGRD